MITTRPLVTATVADRTSAEEIRLDVTGAPPIEVRSCGAREVFQPTGLRIAYDGTATKAITILTTTEPLWVRLDRDEDEPVEPWVTALVDKHRPLSRADAVDRIADVLARHYEGQGPDQLRDEHAAHHREAAAALLPLLGLDDRDQEPDTATVETAPAAEEYVIDVDPCQPYQRYGCGHCPHQDCPNPDCGHCPCKCDCR